MIDPRRFNVDNELFYIVSGFGVSDTIVVSGVHNINDLVTYGLEQEDLSILI